MNYPFLVIAGLLFLSACREKNQESSPGASLHNSGDSARNEQSFFPVESFFRNEIDFVDSLPVGIMKYRKSGDRIDSTYIRIEEFHQLAQEFLEDELKDSAFRKNFKETSLYDRTTKTASFLYTPLNPDLDVKRVDVVTAKGDIYDEVKSIYVEKIETEGTKELLKKLFWKPKRNFQIINISMNNDGKNSTEQIKVVWDNRE